MLTLFGIGNCDTIKKTRKWLQDNGIEHQFHDYKKAGCPAELADRFLKEFSYQELVNTRGTTWRKLPEEVRKNLDSESARQLMQEQTSIIKRPILNAGKKWLLGYNTEEMERLFK